MINKYRDLFFYLNRGIYTFISYLSKYKIPPKPSVMYLELTYRCTCKCGFCERWKIGPRLTKNELTTEEVKRVLSEAYQIGVRYVGFTGGEAFLREDIFKIGKFARDLGLTVTVASNGTLINEDNANKIARTFASITISVDGARAETHDSIRGVKGTYKKAMIALFLLKKRKVPVAVNLVITKKNYKEIDQYIQFFSNKNIPLQLTPVHEYKNNYFKVDEELKQTDIKKFEKEWQRLSKKYNFLNNYYYKHVPTFLSLPDKLLHSYICFAGAVMFFINPYGEVFPCEFKRYSMGNVKKESLSTIWVKAQNLRREISSSKRSCLCWSHCVVPLNHRLTRFFSVDKLFTQ